MKEKLELRNLAGLRMKVCLCLTTNLNNSDLAWESDIMHTRAKIEEIELYKWLSEYNNHLLFLMKTNQCLFLPV